MVYCGSGGAQGGRIRGHYVTPGHVCNVTFECVYNLFQGRQSLYRMRDYGSRGVWYTGICMHSVTSAYVYNVFQGRQSLYRMRDCGSRGA